MIPFFLVKAGRLEAVRPSGTGETRIAEQGPGQFTGEVTMLSGRRALVRIRVIEPGEVIELARENLLTLQEAHASLANMSARMASVETSRFVRLFGR